LIEPRENDLLQAYADRVVRDVDYLLVACVVMVFLSLLTGVSHTHRRRRVVRRHFPSRHAMVRTLGDRHLCAFHR